MHFRENRKPRRLTVARADHEIRQFFVWTSSLFRRGSDPSEIFSRKAEPCVTRCHFASQPPASLPCLRKCSLPPWRPTPSPPASARRPPASPRARPSPPCPSAAPACRCELAKPALSPDGAIRRARDQDRRRRRRVRPARDASIARTASSAVPTPNDAPTPRAMTPRPSTPPRRTDGSRSEPSTPPTGRWRSTRDARSLPLLCGSTARETDRRVPFPRFRLFTQAAPKAAFSVSASVAVRDHLRWIEIVVVIERTVVAHRDALVDDVILQLLRHLARVYSRVSTHRARPLPRVLARVGLGDGLRHPSPLITALALHPCFAFSSSSSSSTVATVSR